jgi:hypothetical protein
MSVEERNLVRALASQSGRAPGVYPSHRLYLLTGLLTRLIGTEKTERDKELRPGSAGRSEIRILYIFDPKRNAVLLAAGAKAGKWEAWYRHVIPLAEQRYEDYLKQEDVR